MKRLKYSYITIIFFLAIALSFTFKDDQLDALVANLDKWRANYPQEKVYLQFDKPYYSIGEDVWFKAYLVNAEQNELSALSKVLYVDVIDSNDSVRRSLVLPVINGLAQGDLLLSDSLYNAGNYHIRAYTAWMKNFDNDFFFDKALEIGDAFSEPMLASAEFKIADADRDIDVKAALKYTLLDGSALLSREVNYSVMVNGKPVAGGKVLTDGNGVINVSARLHNREELKNLVVNARVTTPSGTVFRSFRPSQTGPFTVQFFPEGGNLVAGLRSKVGFKATAANGLGANVTGYIEDDKGTRVIDFASAHAGMGVFAFQPAVNVTYTAVVEQPDGIKKYPLPAAQPSGYVLGINHLGDSLALKLAATQDLTGDKDVIVIAQSNGNIRFVTRMHMDKPAVTSFIPKAKLGSGTVQFTLFSADYRPLAERLVFIAPQDLLKATFTGDKPVYTNRQKVNTGIAITDASGKPVQGAFSIAVTDAEKVDVDKDDESSIVSDLLLTSDLKGFIEKPGYYFNNPTREKVLQLDALMLTQGWRRFTWHDVQTGKFPAITVKAEEGLQISGTINTLGGKPVPNGKVTLLASTAAGPLLADTVADANGRFVFDQLDLNDTSKVMVRAKSAKDRNNVRIILDKVVLPAYKRTYNDNSFDGLTSASLINYLKITNKRFDALSSAGLLNRGRRLNEVKIIDRRPKKIYRSVLPDIVTPDYTLTPEKLQSAANLTTLMGGLNGVIVRSNKIYGRRAGKEGRMMILVDGNPVDDISGISPNSLAGVQIIRGGNMSGSLGGLAGYMQDPNEREPMDAGFGVIVITTDRRARNNSPVNGLAYLRPRGYAATREFYSPAYDVEPAKKVGDFRTTIYWKPDIFTDMDGKASVNFFTADNPGTYRVVMEGLDAKGRLLHSTSTITVR